MQTQKIAYWGMENDMAIPQDDQQYQQEHKSNLKLWMEETFKMVEKLKKQIYEHANQF